MAENDRTLMIVGLGNPGREYVGTRHNVGFAVVDELAARWRLSGLSARSKFGGEVGQSRRFDRTVVLLKPMSYMNLSGGPVGQVAQFHRIPPERILVVCDDVNLPFGTLRLKPSGGAGGHKGLVSIKQTLGTDGFPRLRIGVGGGDPGRDLSNFVLDRFSTEESRQLTTVVDRCCQTLEMVLDRGVEVAMSRFNGSALPPAQDPSEAPKAHSR